jgi:hypothetical protein
MLFSLLAAAAAASAPPACSLSPSDRAWLDRSMAAWNYASSELSGIGHVKSIEAIFFDHECVVTSASAMNGGPNSWSGKEHRGKIVLPDGASIDPIVTSFAGSAEDRGFFVMSTPSVWRAAKVDPRGTTLENLMTFVLLHEASHVAQMPTYGEQVSAAIKRHNLPDDINDDSIQQSFKGDEEIADVVAREASLFAAAGTAKDRDVAISLVRSARSLMKQRYARWYTGERAYMAELEPVFLTLEGSGQWLGYSWGVSPQGAGLDPDVFRPAILKDKWWTQREGLAAFLALDRLVGSDWRAEAFGRGSKDVLTMLDEATGDISH